MSEEYEDDPHKLTDKEKCFRDALAEYRRAFPDKAPNVELFKDWYREMIGGKWEKAGFIRSFGHWAGSVFKTQQIKAGKAAARAKGKPNPEQWRTPDITGPDNKVYDLKFTKSDGTVDPWGSKRGMGGGTQKQDQAAINKQAGVDKAISLDKNSCHCDERKDEHGEPKPAEAEVDANSQFFISTPSPAPAPSKGLPNVPSPGLVPEQTPEPVLRAPAPVRIPEIMPRFIPWP